MGGLAWITTHISYIDSRFFSFDHFNYFFVNSYKKICPKISLNFKTFLGPKISSNVGEVSGNVNQREQATFAKQFKIHWVLFS